MKKILLLSSLALLLLTSCLPAAQQADSTPEQSLPSLAPTDRSIFKNGLPPEYQNILNDLPYASMYDIQFNIADDLVHISGRETVIYTNAEDIALNAIKFRLFPNILGGNLHVNEVNVAGEIIVPNYTLDDSVLTVPLKQALQPHETITLSMDFNLSVPETIEKNYGAQAYYDNVFTLAYAYPMIAVYDDEGWNAEIPSQSGDVTHADMSFFIVTVEAPKGVTLAGSGREISRQDNRSRQTVRYAAGPARDFYLVVSSEYKVLLPRPKK